MGDSNNSGNLTNALSGLKQFKGNDPTLLEIWHEKISIMPSICRPNIHNAMEGQVRLMVETVGEEDKEGDTSTLFFFTAIYT